MIKPTITGDALILEVLGSDKLWSFKSCLTIPLKHILDARVDTEIANTWCHGLKAPGTSIPHVITAGTFYRDGARMFWDIHHPDRAVIISLSHDAYSELVIEVNAPDDFVSQLLSVLKNI
jgi:hypothetical protein